MEAANRIETCRLPEIIEPHSGQPGKHGKDRNDRKYGGAALVAPCFFPKDNGPEPGGPRGERDKDEQEGFYFFST